jgi:hypothetical protein
MTQRGGDNCDVQDHPHYLDSNECRRRDNDCLNYFYRARIPCLANEPVPSDPSDGAFVA